MKKQPVGRGIPPALKKWISEPEWRKFALHELDPDSARVILNLLEATFRGLDDVTPGDREDVMSMALDLADDFRMGWEDFEGRKPGEIAASLQDSDPNTRRHAACALRRLGGRAKSILPALAAALGDDDVDVRRSALEALEAAGKRDDALVAPIEEKLLHDASPQVRLQAAIALGRRRAGVSALLSALKDPAAGVRRASAEFLLGAGAHQEQAVAALRNLLQHESVGYRLVSAKTLLTAGQALEDAVSAAIAVAEGDDEDARSLVPDVLALAGAAGAPALPVLYRLLDHADTSVHDDAERAIRRIRSALRRAGREVPPPVASRLDPAQDRKKLVAWEKQYREEAAEHEYRAKSLRYAWADEAADRAIRLAAQARRRAAEGGSGQARDRQGGLTAPILADNRPWRGPSMWLMTRHGFYSVVLKEPGCYHVRSRERRDLENLVSGVPLPGAVIQESRTTDYAVRIVVGPGELAAILKFLGDTVDYDNFKGRIARTPDQSHKPYHEVWQTLADALGAYGRVARPRREL